MDRIICEALPFIACPTSILGQKSRCPSPGLWQESPPRSSRPKRPHRVPASSSAGSAAGPSRKRSLSGSGLALTTVRGPARGVAHRSLAAHRLGSFRTRLRSRLWRDGVSSRRAWDGCCLRRSASGPAIGIAATAGLGHPHPAPGAGAPRAAPLTPCVRPASFTAAHGSPHADNWAATAPPPAWGTASSNSRWNGSLRGRSPICLLHCWSRLTPAWTSLEVSSKQSKSRAYKIEQDLNSSEHLDTILSVRQC